MRRSATFFAVVGTVVFLASYVRAELIEFKFSGKVEDMYGFMLVWPHPWDRVKVGDSWSLQYSFESTTLPWYSDACHADYSAIKAYSFQMGDVHFTSRSADYDIIELMNNWPTSYDPEHDRYTVCIGFPDASYFTMYLGGPGTCLDSLALPLCGDINLSSFTSFAFGRVLVPDPSGGRDYGYIGVSVTEHACVLTHGTESMTTDTTWRGIGPVGNQEGTPITSVGLDWEAANRGWNTSLTFDDSDAAGWKSCINNREPPYIWVDGPYINGSSPSYYRKVFELSGTPTSGMLSFGVDDDAIIYINGQLAVSDTDGFSTDSSGIDVTPLLVAGTNLIAVKAHDSCGYQESLKVTLDVDVPLEIYATKGSGGGPKAEPPTHVPGPSEPGAGRPRLEPPVYEPSIVAVLANPSSFSQDIQLEAQFFSENPAPPHGQYRWSIVSGADKVKFLGFPLDQTRPRVAVHPIGASTSRNDVKIKVEFMSWTAGVPSCEAYFYMTVAKPTSLRVVAGYPTRPDIYYNDQGRVVGYVVDYAFQVCDQFYQPIPVAGMQVKEEMDVLSWTDRIIFPHQFDTYWTNGGGIWEEQLGTPRPLYKPIPDNYLMEVEQNIYVEGWLVDTRRQTYHHDYATSE
jgi:hypothetical protein